MSGSKDAASKARNMDAAGHRGCFVSLSTALAQRIRRLFDSGLLPVFAPRHGRALGPWGESVAARHLRREGYKILDRNVRLGRNEIDIIARDQDTIVFVEVRTRATLDDAPPEDSITEVKMRHLRRAARHYISRHGGDGTYYRFDAVSVVRSKSGRPELRHFRDAFH